MAWFKVDDNYWSHPKVMFQSLEASGLWIRAASWTANHLTDGRFPVKVGHLIIPRRPATIDSFGEELEALGMWTRDNGDWVFHDWQDYQPSRAAVEEERQRLRERQARWRARRNRPSNGVSDGVTDSVSNGVSNAAPTRPDPTRPDPTHVSTSGGPPGQAASTTHEGSEPSPCEHGSEPRLCALCRRARKTQQ